MKLLSLFSKVEFPRLLESQGHFNYLRDIRWTHHQHTKWVALHIQELCGKGRGPLQSVVCGSVLAGMSLCTFSGDLNELYYLSGRQASVF